MVLNALREFVVGVEKFDLQNLEGFPYEKYEEQWANYTEAERWFNGTALGDQPEAKNKADLYPLRINPIVGTVLKHTSTLFGEVEDDARPLVVPKVKYSSKTEGEKKMALQAERALNDLWEENHGRAIMIENGLMSQVYGGCIFKLTYVPWEGIDQGGRRRTPIRIERISPKNFVATPDASDDYNLLEAWIVRSIDQVEARLWGYTGDEPSVWYVEHWTGETYEIFIDGKPAARKGWELGGENIWKFVPAVYIPHIRIGDFLGFNAYSHLVGMVKEMNLRFGDLGDSVNDDSHPIIAVRNLGGALQVKRVNDWLEYVDLGTDPGLSSAERPPDMFEVNRARTSAAMTTMIDKIQEEYNRDSFVPPVAYGEDEGSQRSSLTLATRFWPLTSHTSIERYFWTPALNLLSQFALRMMAIKGLNEITEKHAQMRIKQKWANQLPKDRAEDVTEWQVRSTSNLASIEHLIEMAGDVEDVEEERDLILQWVTDLEDAKQRAIQKYAMQLQEKQMAGQKDMQKDQLATQEKVAKTQADSFAKRPPPQGGGKPSGGAK